MRFCTRLRNVFIVVVALVVLFTVPAFAVVRLDSTEPTNPPLMGGYWVGGSVSGLGNVLIYLNDNEGWTIDDNGYLFRFSNSSATGRMYVNGVEYTFSASSFAYPRYRLITGTGQQYNDLYLRPTQGNIIVNDNFETPYDMQIMCSVFSCFMLGMLVVIRLVKRG